MGTFQTGGIAAELEKFDGLAKGVNEACEKAVQAGGKALAKRLTEAAPVRKGGGGGGLQKSIKAGKVDYNAADGYHCSVGPTGKNERGEPYAKIGNILAGSGQGHQRDEPETVV